MQHIFFDGHLGCFPVLAIVNSAALNTEVHVSFKIMVFSIFSDHNTMRLDTNYRKKTAKKKQHANSWRLNSTLLNNKEVIKE